MTWEQPSANVTPIDSLDGLDAADVTATAVVGKMSTVADLDIRDDIPLPPLGGFLGRCKINTMMAAGGNSTVYLGELWDMKVPVAVKVLSPRRPMDRPVLAAHLRMEFQVLSRLSHHSVARLWDYRDDPEQPHLATEYVEAMTLDQVRIRHGGRLAPRFAIRMALRILEGLVAAWRMGIAHRDIKPDNLLVLPDGSVKLIDWGMAGYIGEEEPPVANAETIRFIGTPAYLAPERIRLPRSFDHRTDIYGLGATLYHMVTGRLPFAARKPLPMILAHVNDPLVPPYEHVQEPGMLRLSELIVRMMAKLPDERVSNPEELREEFHRILADDSSIRSKLYR